MRRHLRNTSEFWSRLRKQITAVWVVSNLTCYKFVFFVDIYISPFFTDATSIWKQKETIFLKTNLKFYHTDET